jgi:hypothetical protein
MPGWLWGVLITAGLLFLAVRSFYQRFRGMCRRTREELTALLHQDYPDVSVLREERGNLVIRCEGEGEERVWEMADLYSAVARLPGMGQDSQARHRLYQQAARNMCAPKVDGPLTLSKHGALIKPQLLPPDGAEAPRAAILSTEVPGLELAMAYTVDVPHGSRYLTEQDRSDLGLSAAELHELAYSNLGREFPDDLLTQPLSGNSGSALQLADGFDAARLLLLPGKLKPGEALIAVIPHRDMLLLLPASMQDEPDRLSQGLEMLACDEHPALLRRPIRVTPAGFQILR